MTLHDLSQLQKSSVTECNTAGLTDIRSIQVNQEQPVSQRVQAYIEAVENPYLFKVGPVVVKVSFKADGDSLKRALADALSYGGLA